MKRQPVRTGLATRCGAPYTGGRIRQPTPNPFRQEAPLPPSRPSPTARAVPVALLLGLLAAAPADAIVRRHDRADALYRAAAETVRCVLAVGGQGAGTLVAPRWVLTSAHVVAAAGPFERGVRQGDVVVPYDSVCVDGAADLAVVHLAHALPGAKPVRLYDRDDETGQAFTLVGPGAGGDGLIGTNPGDGHLRAARNRVERVEGDRLVFVFDAPPAGEDLEGVPGTGDAGSPALLERDGRTWVVGVASASRADLGVPPHLYGSREDYVRVSAHLDWIRRAIAGGVAGPQAWGPARAIERAGWPADAVGTLARAWIETRNLGDAATMDAFLEHAGDPAYWGALPAERRRAAFAASWQALGPFEPVAWAEGPGGILALLVRTAGRRWLDCRFWPVATAGAGAGTGADHDSPLPPNVRLGRVEWLELAEPPAVDAP